MNDKVISADKHGTPWVGFNEILNEPL